MREVDRGRGPFRIYTPEETQREFSALRDRIFDTTDGGIDHTSERVFVDLSWLRVIVRGALDGSDRSRPPEYGSIEEWANDDPRDELLPLFELLVEDGVDEIIHMSPHRVHQMVRIPAEGEEPSEFSVDAVGVRPTRPGNSLSLADTQSTILPERFLFDRTGQWGFYGSEEEFGLLGGERAFMERYIERAGGMEFLREKADKYWQLVIDENGYEAGLVPYYYELAGWDSPARKRDQ